MATGQYLRMMARYNQWQNSSLFDAAQTLDDAMRREQRGAFWGSIHGTLSHLYWGDRIWLSRFGIADAPGVPLSESGTFMVDWETLASERQALDAAILNWADSYADGPITGVLNWYSGAAGRDVTAPLAVILPHIFNHQTHHRGQVHAMLTAAGAKPADTDMFLMPTEMWAGVERSA
jgi:uncharacterized damage-inducible protein DinB